VAAGVLNALQIVIGVVVVNANLASIDGFESSPEFITYMNCSRSSGGSSGCTPPSTGTDGLGVVLLAFYGTCFVIFLLTLVIYLFAARAAARETGRRGAGIGAAIIAATAGSLLYLVAGVVAVVATGRTGLVFGLGPFAGVDSATWTQSLIILTVIADVVGLLFAVGIGALMGLWGAALGTRHVALPGYPPPMLSGYPAAPPPYARPMLPPTRGPGMGEAPSYAPPEGAAQVPYPPLPSHYEQQPPAAPPLSPWPPTTSTDPPAGGPR
jgi:hypothetical protein